MSLERTVGAGRRSLPLAGLALAVAAIGAAIGISLLAKQLFAPPTWEQQVTRLRWVAYSPTNADPGKGVEPPLASIRADLTALRQAGFTGLVTYSCEGLLGSSLPELAGEAGFEGLFLGLWNPKSEPELQAAIARVRAEEKDPKGKARILGLVVGNEGLDQRYSLAELSSAIDRLRNETGKPVTTTEELHDYGREELLRLGDWVFPNVHAYFANKKAPLEAVRWTEDAYTELRKTTPPAKVLIFKEVGLPTAGSKGEPLSEAAQEEFYTQLAATQVRFVYFEGFDLKWKTLLPVEPHWGLFRADRSPKRAALRLMGLPPDTPTAADPTTDPAPGRSPIPPPSPKAPAHFVYQDLGSPGTVFDPSGYMGDLQHLQVNTACTEKPFAGKTCVRLDYNRGGNGSPAAIGVQGWAGLFFLHPANNWGKDELMKGQGINLSAYNRLVFCARAAEPAQFEFGVGGINERYGDSLRFGRQRLIQVGSTWTEHVIELDNADLSHIVGGFKVTFNNIRNPQGAVLYLDEIRFEKR